MSEITPFDPTFAARVPDVFAEDPIIAWRMWGYRTKDARLHSVTWGPVVWEPLQPLVAQCLGRSQQARSGTAKRKTDIHSVETAPHVHCECGIYATVEDYHLRRDRSLAPYGGDGDAMVVPIIGQVAMWGRVVRHERGYRSQFAYPLTLEVPAATAYLIPTIRAQYGVDVMLAR